MSRSVTTFCGVPHPEAMRILRQRRLCAMLDGNEFDARRIDSVYADFSKQPETTTYTFELDVWFDDKPLSLPT